jgi:acyl-ACP thioesterase
MKDIWQETVTVRFGQVDRSGRVTPAAVFEYFQEAAINHAEDLGVGREALGALRQGWVLSRMSVVVAERPRWRDTVTVRSWPRGADRLFAVRDYDICGSGGSVAARGRAGWLVLDLDRRRPLRPQAMVDRLPPNDGRDALTGSPVGLEARPGLTRVGERTARYSDLDYNGHMNNTRYISWLQDLAEPDLLENAGRFRLDINYLAEVKHGEPVELWSGLVDQPGPTDQSGLADPPGQPDRDGAEERVLAVEGRRAGEAVFRAELRTFPDSV